MEWIKVNINDVLMSSRKDWETMAIIKYQALYSQLETEPNEMQMKRFFKPKEIQFISKLVANESEIVMKSVQNEIQNLQQKRTREKNKYQQKQELKKFSAGRKLAESQQSVILDKIREDKIRIEKENNIKEKASCDVLVQKKSKPKKVFIKPTLNEICDEYYVRTNEVYTDAECVEFAERFLDHYDSVDWKVGKNPMKDWRACVRTWIHNEKNFK